VSATAAICIIGNEILSGKTRDENGPWLTAELRGLGVEVRRIETVPDEPPLIIDSVRRCKEAAKWVFTSGGVGPTLDDLTIPAVAAAFGRRALRHPRLEAIVRRHYGDRTNDALLRMAEVPEGATLIDAAGLLYPAVMIEEVYILPGVPRFLKEKFTAIKERFRAAPIHLRSIYVSVGEGEISAALDDTAGRFAGVLIGSYPRFDTDEYRVRLTLESRDRAAVDAATEHLRRLLPAGAALKVE
jgi:molybdenum cofactor synthesis domain-containing protein